MSRDRYRSIWLDQYSERSRSGEASCHLCHERISGGDGWNQYGWDLRQVFESNRLAVGNGFASEEEALIASLHTLEQFKTDLSDPQSSTYLAEILNDAQPGWREASNNIISFKSGETKPVTAPEGLSCLTRIDASSTLEVCPLENPILESIKQQDIELSLKSIVSGFTAVAGIVSSTSFNKLYIVERAGQVWEVDTTSRSKRLFLDLSSHLVSLSSGVDEQRGLLGFAFHPSYADNGIVITHMSKPYRAGAAHFPSHAGSGNADHLSVVSQWSVLDNETDQAALASNEVELLMIERSTTRPGGGELSFGPDGYLYIAIGAEDAASISSLAHSQYDIYGSILRIDIDPPNPINGRYSIPTTNPYVGQLENDELFALGFRSAQGLSFSAASMNGESALYLTDRGEEHIQELNRISSNSDVNFYGWQNKEGSFYRYQSDDGHTFISVVAPPDADSSSFVDPIAEYDRDEGSSIVGGFVYKGSDIDSLSGTYIFGEAAFDDAQTSSRLFYLNMNNEILDIGAAVLTGLTLQSIGVGSQQEIYLVASNSDAGNGNVLFELQSPEDEFCQVITAKKGNSFTICL